MNYNLTSPTNESLEAAWLVAGPTGSTSENWHPSSSMLHLGKSVSDNPWCAYVVQDPSSGQWRLATIGCFLKYAKFFYVLCEDSKSGERGNGYCQP